MSEEAAEYQVKAKNGIMNDNARNTFASYGLEILKHSVLLVLYQAYLETPSHLSNSKTLSQKKIREHLGLQRVGVANDLILGILEYLKKEKTVEYAAGEDYWSITKKGVSVIEG